MTRGISDPFPISEEIGNATDLPSMAEVDQALQELFSIVAELRTENRVLREIIGASIASVPPKPLTGL